MKQLDGRSKKARALKAAAAEGLRKAAELEAARVGEQAPRESVAGPTGELVLPAGGVGLRGTYVPMDFAQADTASSHQVGGDHYKTLGIEPWDAMESWMTPEEFAGYLRGNAIKYLARCNAKGGKTDIAKAKHYLEKLIEVGGGI